MTEAPRVVVVMPAWNEAGGIGAFIEEIATSFPSEITVGFVVVNDASSDDTASAALGTSATSVTVITNSRNMGHGPSMSRALQAGLDTGADFIISTDGDGQFFGSQFFELARILAKSNVDIVEGVRIRRNEPLFRILTSLVTRILVGLRVRSWPTDANTPTRAYRKGPLNQILAELPKDTLTPDLHISVISRRLELRISELPVLVRERLGGGRNETGWGGQRRWLPSIRFLRFCGQAVFEWASTRSRSQ